MIKKFTLLFLLSLLTLAFSQTDSLNMHLLGVWEPQDDSELVCSYAVVGNYLYVFTGISSSPYQKIYSIDIGGAPSLEVVNMVIRDSDLGEYPFGVLASNDSFLYCVYYSGTGGRYGIGILRLLGDGLWEVAYSGDIVEGASGMYMYPYENDGRIYLAVTCFVEIDGERKPGIRIVDVTDPSSPELLDWYYVPEEITDWYYVVHHNLASISVVYPYLFAFETIEYYDTSYWGGFEEGYVQVKMFDLRDLSAPPVVWRSERIATGTYESMVFISANAADGNVMISYVSHDDFVDILFYNDTGFTDLCELEGCLYWPLSAVNDTYYATRGRGVMAIKALSSCEIETLGYYTSDMWGREYVGIKFLNGRIYAGNRDCIYILEWLWDGVTEEGGSVKEKYNIYPVPVEYGVSARLNKALDRQAGIYDISGKLRSVLRPGTREIDTRKLSPGVYFLISDDKKIRLKFVVI